MPKYKPETDKAKTKSLIKSYSRSGFNQSALARKEGVSQSAINQRLNRLFVQKTFAEMMDREGMSDRYLRRKLKEGLESNKVVGYLNNKIDGTQKVSDEFVEVPDMHARHKYLVTALEVKKHLKHNGNGNGVSISNIVFNFRAADKLISNQEKQIANS